MYEVAKILYQEIKEFISVKELSTGKIYVLPKSVCDLFDMDWASQQEKLASNAFRWEYKVISILLPGDDRHRSVSVIPETKVRTWICGINPEKVKPEIRQPLEAFQDECDRVLHDYWTKGAAINPRIDNVAPFDNDMRQFIGDVVGVAVEKAIAQISTSFVETTVRATVAAIREENKQMLADAVKTTLAEIRSEDPVYLAAKKWDIIERLHSAKQLPDDQLVSAQQTIMNMLIPGTKGTALREKNLTHAAEFLHTKSLQGYTWDYKTTESAAAQLTKAAKKIWEQDNYQAFQESITLKSGRTVSAYVFPIQYAEQAFLKMEQDGKFYKKVD